MPHPDNDEKDVNDVFSDILLSEEHLIGESYKRGYIKGTQGGNLEGYHLGYHRGAEIGSELGYYLGFVENTLSILSQQSCTKNDKKIQHLTSLRLLIESYPRFNSEEIDILKLLDDIRLQFRKVNALLKTNASYPESNKLTF